MKGKQGRETCPRPRPRDGDTPRFDPPPLFTAVLSGFCHLAASPTSVGFMARAAPCSVDAALAKNLPHRSRENEFTDGLF